ncbi:MAG: DUF3791 domain-containing protein, partial [Bacteroidales bacterium]|nr:DUF3791 domain-containing protein [Bacteroidales bacterium]
QPADVVTFTRNRETYRKTDLAAIRNIMESNSQISKFIVFCLEHYRYFKHVSAMEALLSFRQSGAFQYLTDGYEVLHTQSKDYIVSDIDSFILNHSSK